MEKISWNDKVTNEKVLAKVNKTRSMLIPCETVNIVGLKMFCNMIIYFLCERKNGQKNLQKVEEEYKCWMICM